MKNIISTPLLKALCWASLFLSHFSALAQTAIPRTDSTFNHTGSLGLDQVDFFIPQEQAIQSDGKVLAGGYGYGSSGTTYDGVLYRINTDGTLDQSFADNGLLQIDVDGANDAIEALAILPDNKILILLASQLRTIFIRLLPDGSYDPNFGNDGIVLAQQGGSESVYDMAVQEDQKIIVVGYQAITATKSKGVIRRYNADGYADGTYGSNGKVSVVIDPAQTLELYACTLQTDGKLIATGPYGSGGASAFPVIRMNTDGSYDSDFSGDGIYFYNLGNNVYSADARTIAVNAAGNIFVGGAAPTGSDAVLTVLSVKPTGVTNTAFGNFGVAKVPFTIYSSANKILFQPDGKLLAGGFTYTTPTTTELVLARLNANGSLDNTFGQQGKFESHFNANGYDLQIITNIDMSPSGRLSALLWLNETVNLGSGGNNATAYSLRYITDLTVSAAEPSPIFQETSLSPNPVGDQEALTITYQLEDPCEVTLALYDINGRELSILVPARQHSAGEQNEKFFLPENLASGVYFVLLSTEKGYKALRFFKQ